MPMHRREKLYGTCLILASLQGTDLEGKGVKTYRRTHGALWEDHTIRIRANTRFISGNPWLRLYSEDGDDEGVE